MKLIMVAALGAGLYLATRAPEVGEVSDQGQSQGPRGIRNNNPGNIRHGDSWQGMAQEQADSAFVQFEAPEWGVRAMVRILRSYHARGVDTLEEIIETWAPPVENNTEAYIEHVSKATGMLPGHGINPDNSFQMLDLIEAIIAHENGVQPYPRAVLQKGFDLA